jgi:hypothetical protein
MSSSILKVALFAGCLWLASGVASAADTHIPLYHASYAVSRNGFQIGTAEFSLTRNPDGSYSYRSITQPTGLAALFFSDVITESSQFALKDGRPESLRYDYIHSSNDHDRSEHIRFNWDKHNADSSEGKKHKTLAVEPGTYDRALAQFAVSLDMAAGKLADVYCVLDHDEINRYQMEREDDTKLRTPGGTYQVIKVARKDTRKKRITTFWLAPKLDYLPAQIEQIEPGKATISLTLTEIHFDTANSR